VLSAEASGISAAPESTPAAPIPVMRKKFRRLMPAGCANGLFRKILLIFSIHPFHGCALCNRVQPLRVHGGRCGSSWQRTGVPATWLPEAANRMPASLLLTKYIISTQNYNTIAFQHMRGKSRHGGCGSPRCGFFTHTPGRSLCKGVQKRHIRQPDDRCHLKENQANAGNAPADRAAMVLNRHLAHLLLLC